MKPLLQFVLALALGLTAPAGSALDPVDPAAEVVPLYLFSGVQASGVNNVGTATAITCTSYLVADSGSGKLSVEFYDETGSQLGGTFLGSVGTDETHIFVTNSALSLSSASTFSGAVSAAISDGKARVLVSKKNAKSTLCTAQALDAATAIPKHAVALSGARAGKFGFPPVVKP